LPEFGINPFGHQPRSRVLKHGYVSAFDFEDLNGALYNRLPAKKIVFIGSNQIVASPNDQRAAMVRFGHESTPGNTAGPPYTRQDFSKVRTRGGFNVHPVGIVREFLDFGFGSPPWLASAVLCLEPLDAFFYAQATHVVAKRAVCVNGQPSVENRNLNFGTTA